MTKERKRQQCAMDSGRNAPYYKNKNGTRCAIPQTKADRQGSYKTRERYAEAFKRFLRFLAEQYHLQRIANIAPKHFAAYINAMQESGKSASTVKTDLAAIRFFHDQIPNARHTLPGNENFYLKWRQYGGVDCTWGQGELNRMILACWQKNRNDFAACIAIAYHTGLRIHEVMRIDTATARHALRTGDITVKGKGGRVRIVPTNEAVQIVLRDSLASVPAGHKLFVPEGKPTHEVIKELQAFIREHRPDIEEDGRETPLRFQGLRHSYAAGQYAQIRRDGKSDLDAKREVSGLIGHNRTGVVNTYTYSVTQKNPRRGGKGGGGDV